MRLSKKEKLAAKKLITIWIGFLMVIAMSIIGVNFGAHPKLVLGSWLVLVAVNYLCWKKSMNDIDGK